MNDRGIPVDRLIREALGSPLPEGVELYSGDAPARKAAGVTHRADWTAEGFAFVAIPGARFDGHDFIGQAVSRGAVLVVGSRPAEQIDRLGGACYLRVPDPRRALAAFARAYQGFPDRGLSLTGVTGTKGKTTVSWLLHSVLQSAGRRAVLISSAGFKVGDTQPEEFPAHFTTPEAPEVFGVLRSGVDGGCTHGVLEASSHGLRLARLEGIEFEVGIFTNLRPEHLDFHGTMDDYFRAKMLLLEHSRHWIINVDEPRIGRLDDPRIVRYGTVAEAEYRFADVRERPDRMEFRLETPEGTAAVVTGMVGEYNASNITAVIAAARRLGLPLDRVLEALREFDGRIPGRMHTLITEPIRVIVDFAHTPDSLEAMLRALRPTTGGRLIVVIGSAGGDRDPGKREPLGRVAVQEADVAVFTEEDSRDTPLGEILDAMERGAVTAGGVPLRSGTAERDDGYLRIADRRDAIDTAISLARLGDTVVLAGKGTEPTLERMREVLPWDEAAVATEILVVHGYEPKSAI